MKTLAVLVVLVAGCVYSQVAAGDLAVDPMAYDGGAGVPRGQTSLGGIPENLDIPAKEIPSEGSSGHISGPVPDEVFFPLLSSIQAEIECDRCL